MTIHYCLLILNGYQLDRERIANELPTWQKPADLQRLAPTNSIFLGFNPAFEGYSNFSNPFKAMMFFG